MAEPLHFAGVNLILESATPPCSPTAFECCNAVTPKVMLFGWALFRSTPPAPALLAFSAAS